MSLPFTLNNELDHAHLPDKRLQTRLSTMYKQLSRFPAKSLPEALNSHADIKGAYRFFENQDVSTEMILEPHYQHTRERIDQSEVVLLLNDTTDLDFKHMQKVKGLGVINDTKRPGCSLHSLVAFTPQRVCLGSISARFIKRDPEKLGKSKPNRSRPIADKESYRWVEDYRLACHISQNSKAHIIYEADQECDFYEFFAEHQSHTNPADFIIRGKGQRLVSLESKESMALLQAMQQKALIVGTIEFTLPASRGRKTRETRRIKDIAKQYRAERKVKQNIRILTVITKPPQYKKKLPPIKVYVVYLEEVNPPKNVEPVNWILMTSIKVEDEEAAKSVVQYYLARWGIETFFYVLKQGCQIERLQFEESHRLLKCIALYLVVTWRVLYVMSLGRMEPDLSCSLIFDIDEWECVYTLATKKPPPKEGFGMGEIIKYIGQLGGHLGRTRDGPPGPKAVWRGLQKMFAAAEGWKAYKEMMSTKSCG